MKEMVTLIDESGNDVGAAEKLEAHQKGLLHRAFSILVFNSKGEILLQQRALDKYHSPGLWANTCCGHPRPGEPLEQAAHRRLQEEMGFDCELKEIFSFRYFKEFEDGLIEHELDHVFEGSYDGPVRPNESEVAQHKWVTWDFLVEDLAKNPEKYVYWLREIVKLRG